ncbi:F-box/LRR-repeat protein 4-like [Aristolochia californica]|uniref:F-box/LRR-repeat protein 4-like n=1 Tax=Aristolochia californica TaxID=171875 RepID=UPI0035DF8E2C
MDYFNLLCDELLLEILHRLPPSASPTVSLVCKRWLHLHRCSMTVLSLRIPPAATPLSLSALLSRYPSLASLSLIPDSPSADLDLDALLSSVAATAAVSNSLRRIRFLAGPVSPVLLSLLGSSCRNLCSLSVSSLRWLSFRFLVGFPFLKEFSVLDLKAHVSAGEDWEDEEFPVAELPIETLSLSGIGSGVLGLGWLWRSCVNLRKLRLRSCEGTGDSFRFFVQALRGLRELELRTCRMIADRVLFLVARHSLSLSSLLVYDGGSRDGLLWFIARANPNILKMDLRLPLDLEDDHLSAISRNFTKISSFKLQSCCLVTGRGLKSLGHAMGNALEELVLINCDAVEREPGLLTSLGQNLRRLRKLDLSYNDMLYDKELSSMLASCNSLMEIRLRGCGGLTDSVMASMIRNCKQLEIADITHCRGIGLSGIESFVLSLPRLSWIIVEESKLTDAAKAWVSRKIIRAG